MMGKLQDIYECLRQFKEYLYKEEKSPATIEKYLRDAHKFLIFAGDTPITKELVLRFKATLLQRGLAVNSINSMLAAINALLLFLGQEDAKIKSVRQQRQTFCREDKELKKEDYKRLLHAAEKDRRLHLLLQTICSTGIRVSELQYFTVEAVRKSEVRISCKNKTRVILIPGQLRKLLLKYTERKKIYSGSIFITRTGRPMDRSNIWTQMKKLCQKAAVKATKVFPHNLRKLFARTFYSVDKDIAKLADILGHSSINTTRIYIMSSGAEHRRRIEQLGLVLKI